MSKIEDVIVQSRILMTGNGIAENGLFQERQRNEKFNGVNSLYTVGKSPYNDKSGLKTNANIHKDILSDLGCKILNSIAYISTVRQRFKHDEDNKIINLNSYVNRRLRAGMVLKNEKPESPKDVRVRRRIVKLSRRNVR